jgi:hypothetical protein
MGLLIGKILDIQLMFHNYGIGKNGMAAKIFVLTIKGKNKIRKQIFSE